MLLPRFSFQITSCFIILFSILVSLIGCGSDSSVTQPAPTSLPDTSTENKTLTLWHTFDDERRDALEALLADFHKVYPDLQINALYVGSRDDLTKQMTAAIALGTPPDLVLADRRQLAEFAAQGGLVALDDLMNDPELGLSKQDRADYFRGALDLGKIRWLGNRAFGFPFSQEAFVLFYNADAMKTLNVNRAPQTWEQFSEYAAAATHDGKYGWTIRADAAAFEAMLVSRGSAVFTDNETRALFNERAGLASLKLVADLDQGGVARIATSDDQSLREFATGSAAYYMGWMSDLLALRQAQRDVKSSFGIGVGIMPQLDPQTPWLLTRGDLFGITKTSPARVRSAWFLIRWLTAPTQSARWVRSTETMPLTNAALNFVAPASARSIFLDQVFITFKTVPPRLAPPPAPPHVDSIEQIVSSLWLDAVQPKADLRALLDDMVVRVNQMLAVQP